MKVAVAGAGAMGGRVGTQIQQAGYDVTFIDYWEEHVEAVKEKGFEIQTENETYNVSATMIYPSDVTGPFDLVIILTKAMRSEEMLRDLKQYGAINENTSVLTLMNGLGHDERFVKIIPEEQVYLAVTVWTAGLRGPGQLLLEGTGAIEFQRVDGKVTERTYEIQKVFEEAGLNATISDNVMVSVWNKAALNSVINPLCTILDKTIAEFAEYDQAHEMIVPIIEEIVDVGTARGVDLNFDTIVNKIESTYPVEAQGLHHASMHQDLYSGRLTEVDYLNGQIEAYGKELKIPTPNNTLLKHLVHQLELKFAQE
ncbi:ketopantoate reductase family protein [Staphylococcus carnosus]|uniref:2-dehydropantoate 2-reductase n=1 Tax=Staphylococcus carnosus TaxID=1281 RepID=A0AAJ0JQC3_STACA|nr:2-dehydropantoate 2-reductase [Staphylococcus carnosus]KKB25795.1 2-dehydropantoate 2-reductase [Staphylococcus carnosus]POA05496.1 2-dehydropantoate 2-reductase [Staphylococcus carnosus]QQS84321.1 2-dehydropantoate 2-reductase [Staphylococcus carnosus]QRQ04262.1 2-dehydropantoate 2-reductase [Staphylococcus carnosus]UTB83739.1 2-dehydropantoate 2-reductase [Staphylococcus carnosus]